uniref:B12-binding domain-containing radical SAM protein n=1 Tax=uncultured Draconibacterium sp. TaxID=1573823 RepID=UPI0032177EB9
MKILLVYPEYPDTFWSFKYALKFISKKAAFPPLGLLTVSALLPDKWEKKLIDLNTTHLKQKDILWADYVFISAMGTQYSSAVEVIERCNTLGKKIVAGGPLFTEDYEKFESVDHLVLNEAEITLPLFLIDLKNSSAKRIYQTNEFAGIKESPTPDYSLINISNYSSKSIQYSRGCPFNCEFCDITALLGHKTRVKSTDQILNELQNIYDHGGHGAIFFVDDNFIGNKHILKNDLLPALIKWMKAHNHPFLFSTEASINLADDPELLKLMTQAGFATVFIGIETPQESSLDECLKFQNKNRNLMRSVKKIQNAGIEVQGGFIVGFDNDLPGIFKQQIEFIQNSGIISAMIGLLNAPTKSKLYARLHKEGRILSKMSGDNTDASTNIIPKMSITELKSGYQEVIRGIYSGKPFYERVKHFLSDFQPKVKNKTKITFTKVKALLKSIFILGIFNQNRKYYWSLFFWSLFKRPKVFSLAITYSIYGYHYQKVFRKIK